MADSPTTTQTISNLTEKDADSVKDIDIMILEDNEDTKKITFSSVAKVLLGRIKNSGIDFEDTQTSDEITNISSGELLPSLFGKIKNAINGLISHIGNKDNPHGVTGDQIKLSSENVKTAVGYTPANKTDLDQLSSDVNNINSMKIIGRNLQLGTKDWDNSAFLSDSIDNVTITDEELIVTNSSCPCSFIQVETGEYYTISIDIKSNTAYTSPTQGFAVALFSKSGIREISEYTQIPSLGTEWTRYSHTIRIPSGITKISVELINGTALDLVISYRHLKVEKGINATEYLAAPQDADRKIADVASQIGDLGNLTTAQKDNLVNAINSISSSSSPSFATEIQPIYNSENYGYFSGGYVQVGKLVCVDIQVMLGDEYYVGNLLCSGLPSPIDGYALVTVIHSGTMQYGQGYISGGSIFLNIAAGSGNSLCICGSYLSK